MFSTYAFVQRQLGISLASAMYFVLAARKLTEEDNKLVEDAMTFL